MDAFDGLDEYEPGEERQARLPNDLDDLLSDFVDVLYGAQANPPASEQPTLDPIDLSLGASAGDSQSPSSPASASSHSGTAVAHPTGCGSCDHGSRSSTPLGLGALVPPGAPVLQSPLPMPGPVLSTSSEILASLAVEGDDTLVSPAAGAALPLPLPADPATPHRADVVGESMPFTQSTCWGALTKGEQRRGGGHGGVGKRAGGAVHHAATRPASHSLARVCMRPVPCTPPFACVTTQGAVASLTMLALSLTDALSFSLAPAHAGTTVGCEASFTIGKAHFKNKFCARCRERIDLPLTKVSIPNSSQPPSIPVGSQPPLHRYRASSLPNRPRPPPRERSSGARSHSRVARRVHQPAL